MGTCVLTGGLIIPRLYAIHIERAKGGPGPDDDNGADYAGSTTTAPGTGVESTMLSTQLRNRAASVWGQVKDTLEQVPDKMPGMLRRESKLQAPDQSKAEGVSGEEANNRDSLLSPTDNHSNCSSAPMVPNGDSGGGST